MRSERLKRLAGQLAGQFLHEALTSTLRASLLVGVVATLLSHWGGWRYFQSSFDAHDLRRAAAHATHPPTAVAVLGIDDAGYERWFGGRSPLDRARLAALLQAVDDALPQARGFLIDLDLAPLADDPADPVLAALLRHPGRWVLADPVLRDADDTPLRQAWRARLCAAGVHLGLPLVPTAFGYAEGAWQFAGSLAQVALAVDGGQAAPAPSPAPAGGSCQAWQQARAAAARQADGMPARLAAPLAITTLSQGLVVPFSGEVDDSVQLLAAQPPRWVVIGGMWGPHDRIDTPAGLRYGLMVHAAGLQGGLNGERSVGLAARLTVGWLALSLLAVLLALLQQQMATRLGPWASASGPWPGHTFLAQRLWPGGQLALVLIYLLVLTEALAWWHARTGLWIAAAPAAALVVMRTTLGWGWGQNRVVIHEGLREAWRATVLAPLRRDLQSLRDCWARARAHHRPAAEPPAGLPVPSAWRNAVEALLVLVSLAMQTVLPMAMLMWLLLHTG